MEMGSTYAKIMIEQLLNVLALTSMHRSSGNEEHQRAAADWMPQIERTFNSLKRELTKEAVDT